MVRTAGLYMPGETPTLPEDEARRLVSKGAAVVVDDAAELPAAPMAPLLAADGGPLTVAIPIGDDGAPPEQNATINVLGPRIGRRRDAAPHNTR